MPGWRIPYNDSIDERLEHPERFPQKYFVQHAPFESAVCASLCCPPCQLSPKEDFSRYVSMVAIFANTRFHAKLQVRNSLLSCLAYCPWSAFFLRFIESQFDQTDSIQHAKKVESDSPILFLTCPTGKWSILRNSSYRRTVKSILIIKKFGGLVEMPFGLVNASFSLPKW